MRIRRLALVVAALSAPYGSQPLAAQLPSAIFTDPPGDPRPPARMVVLHVPSGGVRINGVAYLGAGPGPHPTFVLMHGLPGNEKNLDLAQAVRRAGWNAITFNYRGSWGSPGSFRFAQTLEDADAVLAFLRDSANARALAIDTTHIVLAGHSMGGWVAAMIAAHDRHLAGAILISPVNLGRPRPRSRLVEVVRKNMESLGGITPESGADELVANATAFDWAHALPGLAGVPLLVLTADDGTAPDATALADSVRARGNKRVRVVHVATDHAWSGRRIQLETLVLRWLEQLR